MGLDDLWLQSNNGKKMNLQNLRELKKSDLKGNSALIKIFNIFDTQKAEGTKGSDGVLSRNELASLFSSIQNAAQSPSGKSLSIFETAEAEEFINSTLTSDGKSLKELGIGSADLFEFLSNLVQIENAPLNSSLTVDNFPTNINLTEKQAQEEVISIISNDAAEARTLLMKQDNGVVSDLYNKYKEWRDDDLSLSNIEEAVVLQQEGADNLYKAKEGKLSKREYFLQNREHLKTMMKRRLFRRDENTGLDFLDRNRGKMTKEQFAKFMEEYINEQIDKIDKLDSIKNIQHRLFVTTDAGVEQMLKNYKQRAEDELLHNPVAEQKLTKIKTPNIPKEFDTTEPMTFEEVFKFERNQEYSKEKVENYLRKKQKTDFVTGAYNKYQSFKMAGDEFLADYDKQTASRYGTSGSMYAPSQPNPENKSKNVVNLFTSYYDNPFKPDLAKEELERLISENNLPISVITNEDGSISLDLSKISNDVQKNKVLNQLVKLEENKLKTDLETILGGSIEEKLTSISSQTQSAYTSAYGQDFTQELAQAMVDDNKTFIQKYTGNTSMVGMGLTVVGGILCFTPAAPLGAGMVTAGNTLAIGGMVAESGLGFADALLKFSPDGAIKLKEHFNEEEIKELGKTFIMNAGGFVIGMQAGKTGMKAFNKLIDKKLAEVFKTEMVRGNRAEALKQVFTNPEYLKNFMQAAGVKLSADFVISYAGDLAMMGVLDTQDDWMSLLQSNLIGIMAGMGGDIKDVAHLGMKGDRYRALRQKEQEGKLSPKEVKELASLRNDPDIKRGYPDDNISGDNSNVSSSSTKMSTGSEQNIKTKDEIIAEAERNSRANRIDLIEQYKDKDEQWLIGEFRRLMANFESSKENTDYQTISDLEIVLEDRGHIFKYKLLGNFNPYGPYSKMTNEQLMLEYNKFSENIIKNFNTNDLKKFLDIRTELEERKVDVSETLAGAASLSNENIPVFQRDISVLKKASTLSPQELNLFGTKYNVVEFFKQDDVVYIKTDNDTEITLDAYNRPVSIIRPTDKYTTETEKYSYASASSTVPFLIEKYVCQALVSVTKQDATSYVQVDYISGNVKTTNNFTGNISDVALKQYEYPVSVARNSKYYENIQSELKSCVTISDVEALKNQYISKQYHIINDDFNNRRNNIIDTDIVGSKTREELDLVRDNCKKQGVVINETDCQKHMETIIRFEIQACKTLDDLIEFKNKYKKENIDVSDDIYNDKLNDVISSDLQSCKDIDDVQKMKKKYAKKGFSIPDDVINNKFYDIIINSLKNCKTEEELKSVQKKYQSKGFNIPNKVLEYFYAKLNSTEFTDIEIDIKSGNRLDNGRFQQHIFNPSDPKYDSDLPGVCREIQSRLERDMGVVSEEQISKMAHDISLRMNVPESEVLDIMSKLTQFGSMKTLSALADRFDRDNIAGFYKDCGISTNSAMNYLAEKKQITFKNDTSGNQAFILDDAGLKYLEGLSKDQIDEFYQKVLAGKIRLYELEGTGLKVGNHYYSYTMLDGSQNLSVMTQEVLRQVQNGKSVDEVLQGDFRQRLNNVFKDTDAGEWFVDSFLETISIKETSTTQNIASQMRPNMPDAAYINKVIDTVVERTKGLTESEKVTARSVIAKYYDYLGKVYSPDSFAELLRTKHEAIEQRVTQIGKTMDDVVYVYPSKEKSFDLVCFQYAKINGIDPSKIIHFDGSLNNKDLNGKVVVILDDVVGSGASMRNQQFCYDDNHKSDSMDSSYLLEIINDNKLNVNVLFAPIACAQNGRANILNSIKNNNRAGKDFLVYDDIQSSNYYKFVSMITPDEYRVLNKVIGSKGYSDCAVVSALATGFQYMTPDNNSSLGGYFNLINLNNSLYNGANKTSSHKDDIGDELRRYLESRR